MIPLRPYHGSTRKLVVAMDIGTTYSGVAYSILDPGERPKIQGITRFPGQENAAGDSKIPSVIYYRRDGTVHSVGAEAAAPGMDLVAEDEDLVFVEWFKLHLRPSTLDSGEIRRSELPPLPEGKAVLDVFADFMRYLLSCTERYISETHANGASLWASVKDHIDFILSHPNGWEGLQQGKMRQAAVMAGLVPDTADGHGRIHFVTEGEASLHFCIRGGLASDVIVDGKNVMIVDAGGGTVDISSYSFVSTGPLSVEEIAPADCIMQGSTRINVRAERFLKEHLKESAYGNEEDIKAMLDYFDKSTKLIFKDGNEKSYVKFGSMGCNDPRVKIRRGQLMLSGVEMESFYKPSLDAIVDTIQGQRQKASKPVSTVFLVGGFAASPWLFGNLQCTLQSLGLSLFRPDSHTNKAVAEGGVSSYLEQFVSTRVIKTTYGIEFSRDYNKRDATHLARRSAKIVRPSGRVVIPGAFSAILTKGTGVSGNEERSMSYQREAHKSKKLNTISMDILCYRGTNKKPEWIDAEPECFPSLCTVVANLSNVTRTPYQGPQGTYYIQVYDVVLMCGQAELKAQIRWKKNGKEMRSPASIIYDDLLESSAR